MPDPSELLACVHDPMATAGYSWQSAELPAWAETEDGRTYTFYSPSGESIGSADFSDYPPEYFVKKQVGQILGEERVTFRIPPLLKKPAKKSVATPEKKANPQPAASPSLEAAPSENPAAAPEEMEYIAQDPNALPENSMTQEVGAFQVDTLYFEDGSSRHVVHDNSLSGYYGEAQLNVAPEDLEKFEGMAGEVAEECFKLNEKRDEGVIVEGPGGNSVICYETLFGGLIRFHRFYDPKGNLKGYMVNNSIVRFKKEGPVEIENNISGIVFPKAVTAHIQKAQ